VEPTGLLGRLAAAIEIGMKARRAADRVYRRIDAAARGELGRLSHVDPFEPAVPLSRSRKRRLDGLLDQLSHRGLDPHVVQRLGEWIEEASAQELARVRPLEFARRFGLNADSVIDAMLRATRLGLLILLWDIRCPKCRVAASIADTVRAIQEHTRCEACQLDFATDFAKSVEMVFRVHPQIREAEVGVYCIGGPSHSPHVVAQVRVAPNERFDLPLRLSEGAYRLRGGQLPFHVDLLAQPGASAFAYRLDLGREPDPGEDRRVAPGVVELTLVNPLDREIVVRVERKVNAEVVTAADATARPLFRQLFPGEVLAPGQLISVSTLALVATELEDVDHLYRHHGDARAISMIHEHFRVLESFARSEGGSLVKSLHNGVLLAFHDVPSALEAALLLEGALSRNEITRPMRLRVAVHAGATVAATLNNQLDYFGQTVNDVLQILRLAGPGQVLGTHQVTTDARVLALLGSGRLRATLVEDSSLVSSLPAVHRIEWRESEKPTAASGLLGGSSSFG
jgi:class 3 adenylate cyclase